MPTHASEFELRTEGPVRAHDVTSQLREIVQQSGVRTGVAVVSVPHTTCAVCVNENEAGLRADLERVAQQVLDPVARAGGFAHDRVDDNARAHLTAILFGNQATVPVQDGAPALGTWQSVFVVELDGPRRRTVRVTVLGD